MSNLSDLLPAGAGAKVITATASGNLATGQTVILQSDGTVKEISATAIVQTLGSTVAFESAATTNISATFDSNSNKVVIAYRDEGNSNYGTAIVGTVDGTSISFGTAVVFESANTQFISATFDSSSNKVVIAYHDAANSGYGTAIVGTVSDTSISFGSAVVFESAYTQNLAATFDSALSKVVIAYEDSGNSNYGTAIVGTVSGTSISFGSAAVWNSGNTDYVSATFDSSAGKVVIVYMDKGNSDHGTAIVGTVSGTSISFGSEVVFNSATTYSASVGFDSSSNKVVVAYQDSGNSNYGTAIIGTVSGTSISFGSEVVFNNASTSANRHFGVTFDSLANKVVISYVNGGDSDKGTLIVGTVSGTSISFGTAVVFNSVGTYWIASTFDSNSDKVVVAYQDASGSTHGEAVVFQNTATNSSDFVGITNQAINNSASGEVVVEGGVITNGSLLPFAYTGSLGSAAVYQSTATEYQGIAFDSSNNKVVVAYKDDSNQHGTAAVGTVSGTGITWGTPVVFAAASTSYCDVVFDSSNNKVVIVYSDVANSEYGTAIVGTVSGTSISFGSEVVFASAATTLIRAAFDSNSNKVVVAYCDNGNSSYGTAIVGTVSGTSISFGTEVVFDSTGTLSAAFGGFVFDSTNNKIVIPYTRAVSHCIVGTVSGTSISFGTKVDFGGTISGQNLSVAFDSNAGKVVINYRDSNNSDYFGSLVGTVSGTSISFGTQLVIQEVHTTATSAFDSSDNQIIYAYKDNSTSTAYYRIGRVSGTSISYDSASALTSGNLAYMDSTFDSSQNTTVIIYKDVANSNYGTAKGLQVTGAVPNFTIGSTYYVQNDGTLATTSSSVTAGKAIANTTLLLKG